MSGGLNVPLLVIITSCILATIADGSRPFEGDRLSTVILRLLKRSQQSATHLPPPQLSLVQRHEKAFPRSMHRQGPDPTVTQIKTEDPGFDQRSAEKSSRASKASSRALSDLNWKSQQYTYNTVLHKNPEGPNPIGNEFRPDNTLHNVKKYRSPPQG